MSIVVTRAVAKEVLDDLRADPGDQQDGGSGVAEIVKSDVGKPGTERGASMASSRDGCIHPAAKQVGEDNGCAVFQILATLPAAPARRPNPG